MQRSFRIDHVIRLGQLFPGADGTYFLILSMCNQAHTHARKGFNVLAAYSRKESQFHRSCFAAGQDLRGSTQNLIGEDCEEVMNQGGGTISGNILWPLSNSMPINSGIDRRLS